MPRNSVFKNIERVRRFKKAGPGGNPKKSKLLSKFKFKPNKLSLPLKLLIGSLVATRIVLSIIPVDFHP